VTLAANFTLSAEEDKDISMTLERKLQSNNLKVAVLSVPAE
jgi:hypothetical protein